jgi:tetratricopeptide (TPR) repeat protein
VFRGVYRAASDLLELAVRGATESPFLHYHLGLAYAEVNDRARAKDHLERALRIAGKFGQANEIREALA